MRIGLEVPAYIYIVRCSDNTLYTGWSTDVDRRVKTHNKGKGARYTRRRRPVILVYKEELPTKQAALKREKEIKSLTRVQKFDLVGLSIEDWKIVDTRRRRQRKYKDADSRHFGRT